jgi:hypothetical protein
MDIRTRQQVAGVIAGVGAVGGALAVLVGLLLASMWIAATNALGITDVHIHHQIWGFLTQWDHKDALYYKDGTVAVPAENAATVNAIPVVWLAGWFTIWVLYEMCEAIWWPIGRLVDASRRHRLNQPKATIVNDGPDTKEYVDDYISQGHKFPRFR